MTKRKLHWTILFLVTLLVVGIGLTMVVSQKRPQTFLVLCGVYVVFLIVFAIWARMTVPKSQRKRPEIPPEFGKVRLGKASPSVLRLLDSGIVVDTAERKDGVHQVVCVEQTYQNGKWICEVEERAGDILAYSTRFQSEFSPALDCGNSQGLGVFFPGGG